MARLRVVILRLFPHSVFTIAYFSWTYLSGGFQTLALSQVELSGSANPRSPIVLVHSAVWLLPRPGSQGEGGAALFPDYPGDETGLGHRGTLCCSQAGHPAAPPDISRFTHLWMLAQGLPLYFLLPKS